MPQPRIAVIGGGIGACSLVYHLREQLAAKQLSMRVFEMGRGPGGRAATRTTREHPALRIDHGVPAFSAHSAAFTSLCTDLTGAGVLRQCTPTSAAFGTLTAQGAFVAEDAAVAPKRFAAADGKGMNALCDALLRGGDLGANPLCEVSFGTMVSHVDRSADGQWCLADKKGEALSDGFDWLIVTSTALAHPRWRSTFGGEPPLVCAAASLGDASLDEALTALAPLTSKPVTACLLAYDGEAAAEWAALPFYKAAVEGDDELSRIVVQRISPSLTAVALHSTHSFAHGASHVYGKTSTAARLAGAASDEQAEAELLEQLLGAASRRLGGAVSAAHLRSPAWGPHLHRWGAAFPDAPLLSADQAVVQSARVAFCGDYVAGDRAGTVEGAALSGMHTADALKRALGL